MEQEKNPVYKDESYGQYRELFYNYNPDGNFETTVHFHEEADRLAMQQAWDTINERIEEAHRQVLEGKVSPIVYYMEKILVDPLNLSMAVGISLWRVKRHFKPHVFNKLKIKTLQKYADAFNISLEQLKNVE